MIIVGIDIGYINMGIVSAVIDENFELKFNDAFKYNISVIKHKLVPVQECTIPHTCETCDRVSHFIQENQYMLEYADCILVERQPPMGFKDIEALIMNKYRSKVKLISPNKLHKHFNMRNLDYEERKKRVVEIATPWIGEIYTFDIEERKHDMADAACMCIMYFNKVKEEQRKKEKLESIKRLPFDEFRYVPPS